MKPPDLPRDHIVASASLGAIARAWSRNAGLLSDEAAEAAAKLLQSHAANLALSPLGRDQILSVALTAAAEGLACGRVPRLDADAGLAGPPPSPGERLAVRRRVFAAGPMRAADSLRTLEMLERRCRPECSDDAELARRLAQEAGLHEEIWDDPRLPGDGRTRFVMLCSVPRLYERAEALALGGKRAVARRCEEATTWR